MPDVPIVKIVVLGFSSVDFFMLGDPVGLIHWVPMQRVCKFKVEPSVDVSGWCIVMLRCSRSDLMRSQMLDRGVRQVHEVTDHYSCDVIIRKLLERRLVMLKAPEEDVTVPVLNDARQVCESCADTIVPVAPSRASMKFIITDEPSERRMFDHDYCIRVVNSKNAQQDAFCGDLKAGDNLIIGSIHDDGLRRSLETLSAERGFRVVSVPPGYGLLRVVREQFAPPGRL